MARRGVAVLVVVAALTALLFSFPTASNAAIRTVVLKVPGCV